MQATVNMTSTYDSRSHDMENSVVARGDLWRVEASHGGSSGNGNSRLFLVQLGPLLFVRDSTVLLPVHLSKQHLLWYGYDRKVQLLANRNNILSFTPTLILVLLMKKEIPVYPSSDDISLPCNCNTSKSPRIGHFMPFHIQF